MFLLSEAPIDSDACAKELLNKRAGALVTFEGWIRNHNDGREVSSLAYEVYGDMALSEGNKVLENARERFAILDAHVVHRIGLAKIGDRAVWVGVSAEHRQEAFLAARWIMDEIKRHVPIWKKETYVNQEEGEWIHASGKTAESTEDPVDNPYYTRQVRLQGFGREGQEKLLNSSILVIGAGGLGCPALQYLASAGVGNIKVVDGDAVEMTNLHRQILFTAADVGRNKAEAAAARLREMNPGISVQAIADAAYSDTLPAILDGIDLVLDCTDGFESKYAIHDTCWQAEVPIVQASVHQLDGWVQIIDPSANAGCYRCQWPEPPPTGCIGTCAEAGVLGVTPGTLGIMQATQAILYLTGHSDALIDSTLYVDVLSGQTRRLKREINKQCNCQKSSDFPTTPNNFLLPGARARELVKKATIVDIREPNERVGNPEWIQQLQNFPRSEWSTILEKCGDRPMILCCSMGIRTKACVELLGYPVGVYAWTKGIRELPVI